MYVVVGASGFLGSYLIRAILEKTDDHVLAVARSVHDGERNTRLSWMSCDVTRHGDILALQDRAGREKVKVLYLAAMHHPDEIRSFPLQAWNTDITALADFLGVFGSVEALYYASTEVVYGETGGLPVDESAPLCPVSRYGELKALAENMVITAGYNVVRYPVLMGPSLVAGRKHFYDEIVDSVAGGKRMEMFCDQRRSMLDFGTAAELTVRLMECGTARRYRVVNIAGDEPLSKYETARRIIRAQGMDESLIVPVAMKDSPVFREKRASETILDNSLAKRLHHLDSITMRFI